MCLQRTGPLTQVAFVCGCDALHHLRAPPSHPCTLQTASCGTGSRPQSGSPASTELRLNQHTHGPALHASALLCLHAKVFKRRLTNVVAVECMHWGVIYRGASVCNTSRVLMQVNK